LRRGDPPREPRRPVAQALVAALGAELPGRYDGFDGSGGEPSPIEKRL
jgi:hypothetical protein